MRRKGIPDTVEVQRYVLEHSGGLSEGHLALIEATEDQFSQHAEFQVPPEQALLLRMLARLTGARRALEIGTFTGLSSMLIAEGLGPDGTLICLDVDESFTALARSAWSAAGLSDRIELRLGPASESLQRLTDERFDFVFIDADKPGYVDYFEAVMPMLEPGGLIVADNTLRAGRVAYPSFDNPTENAVRAFNDHVAADPRVELVVIPAYDGITLIRKR